ncbi:aspartyl protease family protein 2-like [Wolffia australiana]
MAPLFFLLLSSSLLLAGAVELQTLQLAPLSKAPPDDEELAWPTSSDPDSASFALPLRHRDRLRAGNASAEALFQGRLARDARRVAALEAALAERGSGSFASSVVSGLAHGSGEYFTRIGIGTPPTYAYMVLDTGSDVVWIQCAPCRRCYKQADPVFDPARSRSYAAVPCADPACRSLDSGGCDSRRGACLYQVSYGDGSVTAGEFSTETLTFSAGTRIGKVAFGCGHDNEGLFVAAAGLLGLGRGRLSFPSQVGRRFGRRFSYCLVDRTSLAPGGAGSSAIVFGSSAVPAAAVFTRLLTNPSLDTFYYVELVGASVGGARVPGVAASDLRLNPATGKGGVIVDSGTSVTRLARPAYVALRDAFRAGTAGLRPAAGFSLFDTCYDLSGKTEVKVPTVVLHFKGLAAAATADLSLPAENYLIPVDTDGVFCFAFAGTDSGISIIGNIQQQGFRVILDGDGARVGFAPRGC